MKNKLLLTGFLLTAGSFSIYADDPCISSQAPGYCSGRIVDSSVNEARETTRPCGGTAEPSLRE
ncbi:MAG: hypothetical protein U1F16_04415 [Turneriella sp.]